MGVMTLPRPLPYGSERLAAGAPGFLPTSLSGLVHWSRADAANLWQDAARTTPATMNNDPVGAWDDLSAANLPWTQGTAANRPSLKLSQQNGMPMVYFDAAQLQYLLANAIATTYLTGSDLPYSTFTVFRFDNLASGPALTAAGRSTTDTPFSMLGNTGSNYQFSRRDDANLSVNPTSTATVDTTTTHVLITSFTGTAFSAWLDGVQILTSVAADVGVMTVDRWAMGALVRTTATRKMGGYVGEYGLYNRAVTATEAGQIQAYLQGKWATPFTPWMIPNLVHWSRADAAATLWQDSARTTQAVANNDPVGAWDDGSASLVNWTQATAGNRPVLRTAVQNSLPMLHFDTATSQYMSANALSATYIGGSDKPYSLFCVFRFEVNTGQPCLLAAGPSGGTIPISLMSLASAGQYQFFRRDDGNVAVANSATLIPDTSTHVLVLSFAGTSVSLWVDGASQFLSQACDVGTLTVDTWALGAMVRNTVSRQLTGMIGEYGLYSRAITASEANQIYYYLKTKWATP